MKISAEITIDVDAQCNVGRDKDRVLIDNLKISLNNKFGKIDLTNHLPERVVQDIVDILAEAAREEN